MRPVRYSVLLLFLFAGTAHAQTSGDLQIRIGAYSISTDGGEKPVGVWYSTGPVVIGKSSRPTFSVGESCDAFAVSAAEEFATNATAAWKIEVTPIRVVRDAITFRLQTRMAGITGGQLGFSDVLPAPQSSIELTLRPGESWPAVRLRNIARYSCATESSIRVSVDNYPWEETERRLVGVELWLIERLANGSEVQRSQRLSLRGLPNRPFRFYFDSVTEGDSYLDVLGALVARPGLEGVMMTVDIRSRRGSTAKPRTQTVSSFVSLKQDETVELKLPALSDDSGPFAKRSFSIRIRNRQLR